MHEFSITHKHYHTLDYYLKNKYNKKVFKVSLNASFTCPNRDGSKGKNGCSFCSLKGSGDFAGNPKLPLKDQFDEQVKIMEKKWPDSLKIVYFQAYSNTYGSIGKLKETFEPFIGKKDVIGMSVATRCDCIDEEIAEYLSSLKKNFKEFWVELGLQSSKRKSMKELNLCYTLTDFKKAVKLLRSKGIDVIVHIIDGLPEESKEDMVNTVKEVSKMDIQGLKIHVLNILSNTILGKRYLEHPFKVMAEEEFIDIVTTQLTYLKDDVVIHRIGADADEDDLIAPLWVRKKLSITDKIDNFMKENEIFQGDLY